MRYMPTRNMPTRYMPTRYMPMRYMPTRYTPMRCTPLRYIPTRYTPMRYAPTRYMLTRYTYKVYADEVHAHEVHAYEGFLRGPSASEHRHTSVPAPATVSASSHMGFYVVAYGFQSSPWCPKDYYLGRCTVCLGTSAHRPCFDLSVCLSVFNLSVFNLDAELLLWLRAVP